MSSVSIASEHIKVFPFGKTRSSDPFSRALNEATNPTTKTTRATKGTTGKADTKTKGKGKKKMPNSFDISSFCKIN